MRGGGGRHAAFGVSVNWSDSCHLHVTLRNAERCYSSRLKYFSVEKTLALENLMGAVHRKKN